MSVSYRILISHHRIIQLYKHVHFRLVSLELDFRRSNKPDKSNTFPRDMCLLLWGCCKVPPGLWVGSRVNLSETTSFFSTLYVNLIKLRLRDKLCNFPLFIQFWDTWVRVNTLLYLCCRTQIALLMWMIVPTNRWLSIGPSSGSICSHGNSETISLPSQSSMWAYHSI